MEEKNKIQKIYEDYEKFMPIEDIAEKYGNSLAFIRLMIMTSRNEFYAKAKAYDQIKVIHDKHINDYLNMSETECIEEIGYILEDK